MLEMSTHDIISYIFLKISVLIVLLLLLRALIAVTVF
jgi:hypothetical protein